MMGYNHKELPFLTANKSKQTRTFEEVVPEAYHDYKDMFDKEIQ